MKNYSIKDIAKLAGVSVATVSRVINNNGRFSATTKEKVLKVIEETGYKMNYSAKNLRMNKSFTIGILVPDISNYFFSAVVKELENILFTKGYSTIICNTSRSIEKEQAYLNILEGKGIDGLIVISGTKQFDLASFGTDQAIPYICIDREPKEKKQTIFISSDHYQGAFEATEALFQSGCTHPVIAMHSQASTSAKERLRGFKESLVTHQIAFTENSHLLMIEPSNQFFDETVRTFIEDHPEIDGIFSINDLIALDLMRSLKKQGRLIPEEIQLIGFDDIHASSYTTPTLSSVRQDTEGIAAYAAESLLGLLNHSLELGQQIIVPVALVSRASTVKNNT